MTMNTENNNGGEVEIVLVPLNTADVETVLAYLQGARRQKFAAGIEVLSASIERGSWLSRGNIKTAAAFGIGLCPYRGSRAKVPNPEIYDPITNTSSPNPDFQNEKNVSDLEKLLQFGHCRYDSVFLNDTEALRSTLLNERFKDLKKLPSENVALAWLRLYDAYEKAKQILDVARPAPVVTAIGLSPTVTKTLADMGIDDTADLSTLKPAKIVEKFRKVLIKNEKTGKIEEHVVPFPFVEWSQGITHNVSRFADRCRCHACGHLVPSGFFVPVEVYSRKHNGPLALWIGCDCAKNIFGVKDVGVTRE